MATGIRMGWRKLTILALAQITVPMIRMRRTTQNAVSAAGHWVGFVFVGGPLPIGALVLSILFARFLFFGSRASAFCHDSSASEVRFNLKYASPICSKITGSSWSAVFAALSRLFKAWSNFP